MTMMADYVAERIALLVQQSRENKSDLELISAAWRELHRIRFSEEILPESECRFLQIAMIDGSVWQVPYHDVCKLLTENAVGHDDEMQQRRVFLAFLDAETVQMNVDAIGELEWDELLKAGMIQVRLADPPYQVWWARDFKPEIALISERRKND